MKLYTINIRGKKFYFTSNHPLSIETIQAGEQFCKFITMNDESSDAATLYGKFLIHMTVTLRQNITPITIDHIFRINYS